MNILQNVWQEFLEDLSVFKGSKPFFKKAAVYAIVVAMVINVVSMWYIGAVSLAVFVIGSLIWFADIMFFTAMGFFLFMHGRKDWLAYKKKQDK